MQLPMAVTINPFQLFVRVYAPFYAVNHDLGNQIKYASVSGSGVDFHWLLFQI